MILSPEAYLWFKSLHIIGVVVWFAGLFYLVRLFIYHAEIADQPSVVAKAFHDQYSLMENRLANIITTPGMILTILMAAGLLYMQPQYLYELWMQIKLFFVSLLFIYHLYCYRVKYQLQQKSYNFSGRQLRILNEIPTIFLVIVVMLVVFKNNFPTSAASWFIAGLIIFMALSIQFYARYRRLKAQNTAN